MDSATLSVIVPVYNERFLVAEALARLSEVDVPGVSRLDCFECPGGYLRPQRVRIFEDSAPSRNTGEELSVYVQDRIDVGDKWRGFARADVTPSVRFLPMLML